MLVAPGRPSLGRRLQDAIEGEEAGPWEGIYQRRHPQSRAERMTRRTIALGGGHVISIIKHVKTVAGEGAITPIVQVEPRRKHKPATLIQVSGDLFLILSGQWTVPIIAGVPEDHRVPLHAYGRRTIQSVGAADLRHAPEVIGDADALEDACVCLGNLIPSMIVHYQQRSGCLGGKCHDLGRSSQRDSPGGEGKSLAHVGAQAGWDIHRDRHLG